MFANLEGLPPAVCLDCQLPLRLTKTGHFFQARGNEDPSGKLRPEIVEEVGEKYATIVMTNGGKRQQQNHAKLIQVGLSSKICRD